MNINVESHFAQLPAAEIQRSVFDRSATYKTSFNASELIPFYIDEVLPGDTFDITTAKVVRSQTLLTPVMDDMYLDTYYFFVPNRLVWEHWREFCGENTQGPWAPATSYRIPKISAPTGGFQVGSLADYFGLPVNVEWSANDPLAPSALPFRAYSLICNEFFRDENLSDPLFTPTGDANQTGSNGTDYVNDVANGGKPFKVAKYHDYFTSCLPAPQKGAAVTIPIDINGYAPVYTSQEMNVFPNQNIFPMVFGALPALKPTISDGKLSDTSATQKTADGSFYIGSSNVNGGTIQSTAINDTESANARMLTYPQNLYADVTGDFATGVNINELRLAFAYQRYLESMARNGSRYTELLLGLFGVRSPDARLQRPEYLGGNRISVNVAEITNQAQSQQDFLGDLGAKSVTNDLNHDFVKSFTEHGYIIGVMAVRYDHSYAQGIQRFWTRTEFTDFYNPKFANLGEVPVYKAEIYADSTTMADKSVFGYQEIWADYRYKPNVVTSEMRPGVTNSLAFWHLADNYTQAPTLSDSWIRESVDNVDRVLAVSHSVANQFWADIYVQNRCTRPMPMYSVPGMIDHF